jgi:hypothetical protein
MGMGQPGQKSKTRKRYKITSLIGMWSNLAMQGQHHLDIHNSEKSSATHATVT